MVPFVESSARFSVLIIRIIIVIVFPGGAAILYGVRRNIFLPSCFGLWINLLRLTFGDLFCPFFHRFLLFFYFLSFLVFFFLSFFHLLSDFLLFNIFVLCNTSCTKHVLTFSFNWFFYNCCKLKYVCNVSWDLWGALWNLNLIWL